MVAVRARGLPSMKMRLGITASRVGGHHPLKGCPECIQEDMTKHGHAYWHLRHQFPSAMACTRHARTLFIAWDPVSPVHRRHWLQPVGGLPWQRIDVPMLGERQLEQLLRLAEFSKRFADCCAGAFDPHRLARCYQAGLRGQGLATARGSLRLKLLIDETKRRYKGIEDIPGFEALRAVTPDWPGLVGAITRRSPRHAHPLKHLLVIALIFETWAEFVRGYESSESDGIGDAPALLPSCPPIGADALRELVTVEGLSVSAAARKLGISITSAVQIAKLHSIPFSPRPKRLKGQLLRHAQRLLQRGTPVKQIARDIGLSVTALNRFRAVDPALNQAWATSTYVHRRDLARKAFLFAVRKCDQASMKAVRRVPGNNYMWLYRHDRAWLGSQIPSLWSNFHDRSN